MHLPRTFPIHQSLIARHSFTDTNLCGIRRYSISQFEPRALLAELPRHLQLSSPCRLPTPPQPACYVSSPRSDLLGGRKANLAVNWLVPEDRLAYDVGCSRHDDNCPPFQLYPQASFDQFREIQLIGICIVDEASTGYYIYGMVSSMLCSLLPAMRWEG